MNKMQIQQLKTQCRILLRDNYGIYLRASKLQEVTLEQLQAIITILSQGKPDLDVALQMIREQQAEGEAS